jgi:hypothetical protein
MRQSIDCHFILFSALHSISEVYIFHLGAIELTIATMSLKSKDAVLMKYMLLDLYPPASAPQQVSYITLSMSKVVYVNYMYMEDDFMIQRNRLHLMLELQCKEQKSLGLVALFITRRSTKR